MQDAKLSIVMPSLNQGKFLARAVTSVLSQSYRSVELIVMDGGSTDQSLDVLRHFAKKDARIRWSSEPDAGQADAVNKGIQQATGEVVGWLNSDDIFYPEAFRAVMKKFDARSDVEAVFGEGDHVDLNDRFLRRHPTEPWSFDRLTQSVILSQPSVFVRRSVFHRCGLLDKSLHYCMDYELWIRLAQSGVRFEYIPWVLSATRFHEEAKTLKHRVRMHAEVNDMLRARLGRVPEAWLLNYAFVAAGADGVLRWSTPARMLLVLPYALQAAWRWNRQVSLGTLLAWGEGMAEKTIRALERRRAA